MSPQTGAAVRHRPRSRSGRGRDRPFRGPGTHLQPGRGWRGHGTSVCEEVDEGDGEHSASAWLAFNVPKLKEAKMRAERSLLTPPMMSPRRQRTHPPLAVLLAVNYNHLPLTEGQLVRMVGRTVVDGLHPLRLLLLQDTESRALSRHPVTGRRRDLPRRCSWAWGWAVLGAVGTWTQALWRQQKQKQLVAQLFLMSKRSRCFQKLTWWGSLLGVVPTGNPGRWSLWTLAL